MNIVEAVSLKFTVVGNSRYKRTREHDSLVLDTESQTYYWNSKSEFGTVADFLIRYCGFTPKMAVSLADEPIKFVYKDTEIKNKKIHLSYWDNGKNHRDFWYKRGYTDAIIDMYRLGYFAGMYSIPFVYHGDLNALYLRDEHKNFQNVSGGKLSLFGYDQVENDTLLLVESPLDVPILKQHGFDAVSHNYGVNAWDNSWNKDLLNHTVIVIPDNDAGGRKVINTLSIPCNVAVWPSKTPQYFDINKLYLSNPEGFVKNVNMLVEHSVPLYFLTDRIV